MKSEKQTAAADRKDISVIDTLCVIGMEKYIELNNGRKDLFTLLVKDRKSEKQTAAADRKDISAIVGLCVVVMEKYIELSNGHKDLFSLSVKDQKKLPLVSTVHGVVALACFTAR